MMIKASALHPANNIIESYGFVRQHSRLQSEDFRFGKVNRDRFNTLVRKNSVPVASMLS